MKFPIRPAKVRIALEWLKNNNRHYRDVTLNFDSLDEWADQEEHVVMVEDDDLPKGLKNPTVCEDKPSDDTDSQSREVLLDANDHDDVIKKLGESLHSTEGMHDLSYYK